MKKQFDHTNARTNRHLHLKIQRSNLTNEALSKQYGVSVNTILKWKNWSNYEDKSSRFHHIKYSLSELFMIISVELRSFTWWSLDEITEALSPGDPRKIRSAVYSTFVREGINKVPEKIKEKQRSLKNMTLAIYILMLLICLK
jgi:transposase